MAGLPRPLEVFEPTGCPTWRVISLMTTSFLAAFRRAPCGGSPVHRPRLRRSAARAVMTWTGMCRIKSLEAALSREGLHEARLLQRPQHVQGDAAGQVEPARSPAPSARGCRLRSPRIETSMSTVARHSSLGSLGIDGGVHDRPGTVLGRGDRSPRPRDCSGSFSFVAKVVVDVGKRRSRSTRARTRRDRSAAAGTWRSPICRSSVGAKSEWPPSELCARVPPAIPGEERFAQTRPRRDDRDRAPLDRLALVQGDEVLRPQDGHGPRDRFEVVHEMDGLEVQVPGQRALVHHPGQVGRLHAPVDHGAGDVEARRRRPASSPRRETPGPSPAGWDSRRC